MQEKTVQRLRIVGLITELVFLWMGSACFIAIILWKPPASGTTPSVGDLATIFFGASSLALIIFSLVIAIAAVIEWHSLKEDVRKVIEAAESAQEKSAQALAEGKEQSERLFETMQRRMATLEEKVKEDVRRIIEAAERAQESSSGALAENKTQTEELFETIQMRIAALEEKVEKRVLEMRGRVSTVMGYAIGTIHSDPFAPKQKEEDKDFLREAIHSCEQGFQTLLPLEGNGKYMALNNVLYFSCLLGAEGEGERLLGFARDILRVAQGYPDSPWAIPYLTTYCRTVVTYGSEAPDLLQADEVAQGLVKSPLLTTLQRKEATMLVAAIAARVQSSSGPAC